MRELHDLIHFRSDQSILMASNKAPQTRVDFTYTYIRLHDKNNNAMDTMLTLSFPNNIQLLVRCLWMEVVHNEAA